jgi:mono/diheme cytochrome c family protein
MALDEGVLYLVTAGERSGTIAAIAVASGEAMWEQELPGVPVGAATVADDTVFTALEDGTVVGLSRKSGQVLWEEQLAGGVEAPLLIEGDTVFAVGGESPQLVAYGLGAAEEPKEAEEETKPEESREEAGGEAAEGGGAEAGGNEALLAEGKTVFSTNCATCHTLADAGATGEVGPNLDELQPEKALVETQVTNGGGGMPPFGGTLSQEEIEAVAEYVSSVAGN